MKSNMIESPMRVLITLAVLGLLGMGACKSKKKAVEASPEPTYEAPAATPEPTQPVASEEEVAVEKLENYFDAIAGAATVQSANSSINEAVGMFSSTEVPVLVVIYEENGIKDYDEPTTISKYLHYLKDTQKNINFISDVRLDANGRVSELELRRK